MHQSNKARSFWWSLGPSPGNFGDLLTPYIFAHYQIPVVWADKKKADGLCVGSVAKFARPGMTIVGTGTMRASDPLEPRANWLSVRGPYTRDCVLKSCAYCPEGYGDPGLLISKIVPAKQKRYKLGFVPHYVDYAEVVARYPNERVIDILRADPLQVAAEISECETIISSSLHGIIAAHSYNIPCAWVKFSDKLSGDGIKFLDHYASVGLECVESKITDPVFSTALNINTQSLENVICSLR